MHRGWRENHGMVFTVLQYSVLDSADYLIDRLLFVIGDLIEGGLVLHIRLIHLQRAIEVGFGYMADMRNHANRHPGANGAHITRFGSMILLLETLHRPEGIYSSKGEYSQHNTQQQAEQAQSGTFTQRVHLILVSFYFHSEKSYLANESVVRNASCMT